MNVIVVAIGAVLVAALQVNVVPLFPISGATAELAVVFILVVLMLSGPPSAMLATPMIALAIGFAGVREPGLLLLAYTPVLLFGYLFDRFELPPGKLSRLLATALIAGVWVRLVQSAGAFVGGAAFDPFALLTEVITPGFIFDVALVTLAFMVLRLFGRTDLRYVVERRGWLP